VIGDPTLITVWELGKILDDDETFNAEALAILKTDYVDVKSTFTTASSALALLDRWLHRRELKCKDERGEEVHDFNAVLFRDNSGSFDEALEVVERGWLISRKEFIELLESYAMAVPAALLPKVGSAEARVVDLSNGVTRNGVIGAFSVKADGAENEKWWDRRLRDPPQGLLPARLARGATGKGKGAVWDPVYVACWLLDMGYVPIGRLDGMMKRNFPKRMAEWEQATDDHRGIDGSN
jgi:hypothetical protein